MTLALWHGLRGKRPVSCRPAQIALALLTAACAAAEERKPVSYKLKKGELDAPDPTPQRSEGPGDEEPDEDSDEAGNGEQAASEDSSEAEQDGEGAAADVAQKEKDMQVQEFPCHGAALCPCACIPPSLAWKSGHVCRQV